jgi:hypothetical protein
LPGLPAVAHRAKAGRARRLEKIAVLSAGAPGAKGEGAFFPMKYSADPDR